MLVVAFVGCAELAQIGEGPEQAPSAVPTSATDIEIGPTTIDFGDVQCGTEAQSRLITIHNKGSADAPYKIELPAGTTFRLEGSAEGIVPAKRTVTLQLFAKPEAARESTADFIATAGDAVQGIHVRANAVGATFEMLQSTIDFGDVRKENGSTPVDVEVKNTGTETATVSGFTLSAPGFDVQWAGKPAALKVEPGAQATFTVTLASAIAADAAPLQAEITPVSAQAFCGTTRPLSVNGRRITSDVTVSPADWGKRNCNTTPAFKDIVITNYANAFLNYTATWPTSSMSFALVDAGPGTLLPAPTPMAPTTAKIRVAPKALGPTLRDIRETLSLALTSTAPGVSGSRDVPLHVDVRGAILTFVPTEMKNFSSTSNQRQTQTFTLRNGGNEPAFLTWAFQRTAGGTAWTYSPPEMVPANDQRNGTVGFKPSTSGLSSATLTPSTTAASAPACNGTMPFALEGTRR